MSASERSAVVMFIASLIFGGLAIALSVLGFSLEVWAAVPVLVIALAPGVLATIAVFLFIVAVARIVAERKRYRA